MEYTVKRLYGEFFILFHSNENWSDDLEMGAFATLPNAIWDGFLFGPPDLGESTKQKLNDFQRKMLTMNYGGADIQNTPLEVPGNDLRNIVCFFCKLIET